MTLLLRAKEELDRGSDVLLERKHFGLWMREKQARMLLDVVGASNVTFLVFHTPANVLESRIESRRKSLGIRAHKKTPSEQVQEDVGHMAASGKYRVELQALGSKVIDLTYGQEFDEAMKLFE